MLKSKLITNFHRAFHWKGSNWKEWQAYRRNIRSTEASFYTSKNDICSHSFSTLRTPNLLSRSRLKIKEPYDIRFFLSFRNLHSFQLINRSCNSIYCGALKLSSPQRKYQYKKIYSNVIHRNLTFNSLHKFVKDFIQTSQFSHLNSSFSNKKYRYPNLEFDDHETNNLRILKTSKGKNEQISCIIFASNKEYMKTYNNTTNLSIGPIQHSFHSKSQPPLSSSDHKSRKKIVSNIENNESNHGHQTRMQAFSSQLRSVPNLITMGRICVTPYLSYLIYTHEYQMALYGCALAAVSDYIDGYIAKNYNSATVLGTYLDPLGDKVIINILAFSLYSQSIIPLWAAGLWLARDIGLITTTYWFVRNQTDLKVDQAVIDPGRTPLKVKPTMISKVNTVLQFATIGGGIGVGMMDGLGSNYLLALW